MNLGYWGYYGSCFSTVRDAHIFANYQILSFSTTLGALYGPEPVRQVLWGAIWSALSTIPGSKHYFEKDVGPESILHSRAKTLAGVPNLLELDWISWHKNGTHNFFSPISAVTGKAAIAQVELVERKAREYGFYFMNTLIVGLRELHNINCLVHNRKSKEERGRMRKCTQECIDEAAEKGWGEYRTVS